MLKSTLSPSDRAVLEPAPAETAVPGPIAEASPVPQGGSAASTQAAAATFLGDLPEGNAVIEEVVADPDAVGLILHGSRASGSAGPESNVDFTCLLTDAAFQRRSDRGTVVERRFRTGAPTVEVSYEGIGAFRRSARSGSRRGAAFALAKVVVDKTGEIATLVEQLLAADEPDPDSVADQYDRYLHGFAHSLKSWSRGDDLGARAHAAQSGLNLVSALFALEGKPAPYLDHLLNRLAELDAPQGWRPGFLPSAVHRLFYAPDPPFQQMLERRVSRLMESRGVLHQWRHDLDRLRTVSYDEL